MAMKKKGYKNGGKVKPKGMANGGKVQSKGAAAGGLMAQGMKPVRIF